MFSPAEIGSRIVADNHKNDHYTADPIFGVQQRIRHYGIEPEYTEDFVWLHGDEYSELSQSDAAVAEKYFRKHSRAPLFISDGIAYGPGHSIEDFEDHFAGFRRMGYRDMWEFVQPFFTKAGAERYIEENGHNLKHPRVYVYSAFRNREWQAMRQHLRAAVADQAIDELRAAVAK